jgi:hypothetical protein
MNRFQKTLLCRLALTDWCVVRREQTAKPLRNSAMTDLVDRFLRRPDQVPPPWKKMAVLGFGGTLFGRPAEILLNDHRIEPDVAASKTREWFDAERSPCPPPCDAKGSRVLH